MRLRFFSVRQHEMAEQAQLAEASARESEERYRTLFELVPVAVYSCDAAGEIQKFNRRAVELWGRKPELGDTAEGFWGSYKLFRPDGRFLSYAECPMAEVLSGNTGGFSGRRFCRIFPCGDQWLLQLEKGGWSRSAEDESHKTFPTLTAAITMPSSAASTIASCTFRRARRPMHAGRLPCYPKNSGGGVLTAEWPLLTRKSGGPMGA